MSAADEEDVMAELEALQAAQVCARFFRGSLSQSVPYSPLALSPDCAAQCTYQRSAYDHTSRSSGARRGGRGTSTKKEDCDGRLRTGVVLDYGDLTERSVRVLYSCILGSVRAVVFLGH